MVYYVAYRAPGDLAYRSQIAYQLQALGCKRISRSLCEVGEESVSAVAKMLHKNSPVFLKRIREIRRPCFSREGTCSELGSLIVVAYELSEEGDKGKIKSFVKRAPCIRLGYGAYAFSQRQRRFHKSQRLVDARSFWENIRGIDEKAVMIPRLIILNDQVVGRLLLETKRRVEKEVCGVVEGYRILFQKVKRGEIDPHHAVRMTRKLRRRFIIAKSVASFYEEWLGVDLSNILIKPYPAIRRVRSLLEEEYGTAR